MCGVSIGSEGLRTLGDRHATVGVAIRGDTIRFQFDGLTLSYRTIALSSRAVMLSDIRCIPLWWWG